MNNEQQWTTRNNTGQQWTTIRGAVFDILDYNDEVDDVDDDDYDDDDAENENENVGYPSFLLDTIIDPPAFSANPSIYSLSLSLSRGSSVIL